MAFGCRDSASAGQWIPNSETSASSTLSALAQPFIVVRNDPKLPDISEPAYRDRVYRFVQPVPPSAPTEVYPPAATVTTDLHHRQVGNFPSGGSNCPVRRALSRNLVQAEPFYPQYGFRGSGPSKPPPAGFGFNDRSDYGYSGRNHTHWNEPFDGDSEWETGTGRRISSWMEPMGTEGIGRCLHARDNKTLESSTWAESSCKGPISNYVPAVQNGDNGHASLSYENGWHRNGTDSCIIKGPDSGCINWLDGSSMYSQSSRRRDSGFHRSDRNDHYVANAYSYPKTSSPALSSMNPFPSSIVQVGKANAEPSEHQNNSLQRHRVSVIIREPRKNAHTDAGKLSVDRKDKCNGMSETSELPKSSVNKNGPDSELKTDDVTNFSDSESTEGKMHLQINGSTDLNDTNHNSMTLDHSNNSVDSPCWKGASASRYSPLYDSDYLEACFNTAQKSEDVKLASLTENDTKNVLEESKGDCPPTESYFLQSGRNENIGLFMTNSINGNGFLNDNATTQSFFLDSASDMYQHAKVDIQSSSFDISNLQRSAEHKVSEVKDISTRNYFDTHFLVRSIYDLSALLSSNYNGENTLKDHDYDILLVAKHNLEACLAKNFGQQKKNFVCEQKASYAADACDPAEECRKTLTQKVCAQGENCESDAYKRLWIEAEAALCSMKYQLQVVRASVGLSNALKQMGKDLQGSLELGESPVGTKTSPTTAACDLIAESLPPTTISEALMKTTAGFGDDSSSCVNEPHVTSEINQDLETSVMARLNVLRSRDNKISTMNTEQHNKPQSLIESEADLSINQTSSLFSDSHFITGRSFVELSEPTSAKSSQPPVFLSNVRSEEEKRAFFFDINAGHENQAGLASSERQEAQSHLEEGHFASRTGNVIESYIPDNGLWGAQLTGKHSTASSSDWEHVLREEITRSMGLSSVFTL